MEAYQTRLASFSKSKRIKNPSLTTSTSLRWPHPSLFKANPKTLAEAGFFFSPSWDDRDNVKCFMCGKDLSDWVEDDDPFVIHWEKCRASCVWAQVRCGLMEDIDETGRYIFPNKTRIPSSKAMEKARIGTFTANNWWPHDNLTNHGASSKKMAQAGFVYTPQESLDDTATCLYCNISLSGWEPEDDPLHEHRKREKKSGLPCPFFAPSSGSSSKLDAAPASKPPSTTNTKAKGKSKLKQSIKPSRSKKEPEHAKEVGESDDELELAPLPIRKGRSTSTAKPKPNTNVKAEAEVNQRRVTRGVASAMSEVEEVVVEKKPKRKVPKKSVKKAEIIEESVDDDEASEVILEKPKKGQEKSRSTIIMATEENQMDTDELPPIVKFKSRAFHSKSHTIDSALEPDTSAAHTKPRTVRSKTRVDLQSDAESQSDALITKPEPESTPIAHKKVTRSKVVKPVESEFEALTTERTKTKAKKAPANKKPAAKAAAATSQMDVDPQTETETETDADTKGSRVATDSVNGAEESEQDRHSGMRIVDISTDDEETPPPPAQILPERRLDPEPTPKAMAKPKDAKIAEKMAQSPTPYPEELLSEVEKESEVRESVPIPLPSTPPQPQSRYDLTPVNDLWLTSYPGATLPLSALPALATVPLPHIVALSEAEQDMTVEEWIRHEIELQYGQLKGDGEARISAFKEKAEEVRKRIDAL